MTINGAPGYAPLENDVPWDPGYLELVPPERVLMLDVLGSGRGGADRALARRHHEPVPLPER